MELNEQQIDDITMSSSELDDVMLTLVERSNGRRYPVPARLMSDGSLRFLAILVALLQAPNTETVPDRLASVDAAGQTTLVIEELENGLHASQAGTLIGLIRDQVTDTPRPSTRNGSQPGPARRAHRRVSTAM